MQSMLLLVVIQRNWSSPSLPRTLEEKQLPQCNILTCSILHSDFVQSQTGSWVYVCPWLQSTCQKISCTIQGCTYKGTNLCTHFICTGICGYIRMLHRSAVNQNSFTSVLTPDLSGASETALEMTLKITFDPNIPTVHASETYETCSHIVNEVGHNTLLYSGGLNEVRRKIYVWL